MKDKILSTKEAAEILGCHADTVLKRIKDGQIKPVKWINSRVCLIPQSALDNLMKTEETP